MQVKLAECRALARHLDLLNWYVADENTHGRMNPADSSSPSRCTGLRAMHRIYTLLTEVIGATGHLKEGSPGAELSAASRPPTAPSGS